MDQQQNKRTTDAQELNAFAEQIAAEASPTPIWIDETGRPNIQKLSASVIVAYDIKLRGSRLIDSTNGKIISAETLKRYVMQEVQGHVPNAPKVIRDAVAAIRLQAPVVDIYRLNTITAADLKTKTLPPPTFIVKDLLPCGLCVLAAPPKTGKSWMCLALADAIATGKNFLGFEVSTPGKVLYLALEDSESRIKNRLQQIGSAMPENLSFVFRNIARLNEGLCEQIGNFIDDNQDARCVIIDTIGRVKSGSSMGLNAYEADTQQYSILQELALQKNVAIVCVTHFSKLNQYGSGDDPFERITGSTGLFGVSDAAWLIFGKRGAEEMTFKITGRDSLDKEYKVKFDQNKAQWIRLGTADEVEQQKELAEYSTDPLIKTIRRLVSDGGIWTGSAEDLKQKCIEFEKQLPADSMTALGHKLTNWEKMLLSVDGIVFTRGPGGRKGRGYTFRDTKYKTLVD